MKKATFVFVFLGVILLGCNKMPVYKSTWHQPVLLDEKTGQQWVKGMNYDSESGIMYGLSNDTENLYIKMKFGNEVLGTKVMMTGLTLWIDTLGKKDKQLGLVFPVKSGGNEIQGRDAMKRSGQEINIKHHIDTAVFNSKFREGMETMQLLNYFGNGRIDMMDNQNDDGISALLWKDEENLIYYEAIISLQKIFPNPQKFLNDTAQYFSFGIETGKIEMPTMGNSGGRPQMGGGGSRGGGSRGGSAMGGMNGGGSPPGGSRGGAGMDSDKMAMMQALSEQSKVWVKKAYLTGQ